MIKRIKNKIAKLIWRKNEWTIAVDQIENAVNDLREGKMNEIILKWTFGFMKTPPSNKIICKISLDNS